MLGTGDKMMSKAALCLLGRGCHRLRGMASEVGPEERSRGQVRMRLGPAEPAPGARPAGQATTAKGTGQALAYLPKASLSPLPNLGERDAGIRLQGSRTSLGSPRILCAPHPQYWEFFYNVGSSVLVTNPEFQSTSWALGTVQNYHKNCWIDKIIM